MVKRPSGVMISGTENNIYKGAKGGNVEGKCCLAPEMGSFVGHMPAPLRCWLHLLKRSTSQGNAHHHANHLL